MDESSSRAVPRDDAELISAIASGDAGAYARLHERHVAAARTLAGLLTAAPGAAEDVLSEAFARLRRVLRDGGGPRAAVRPYLLTAVRRVNAERKTAPPAAGPGATGPDAAAGPGDQAPDLGNPLAVDPGAADLLQSPLGLAFGSLSERQRAALWHAVIEDAEPEVAAGPLGVAADEVADLAGRASAALVRAYLSRYAAGLAREDCRAAVAGLGVTADGTLRGLDAGSTAPHLRACRDCRTAAIELADLGRSLRRTIAPIYLGAAAGSYLAWAGAGPRSGPAAGPPAARAAALAASGQRWLREAPRQQHALAGGGLLLAAVAVIGLALILGGNNAAPRPAGHHRVAAVAAPPSPSAAAPSPAPQHRPAAGRPARRAKPANPAPAPSPSPSPQAAAPSPTPAPPSPAPSPTSVMKSDPPPAPPVRHRHSPPF